MKRIRAVSIAAAVVLTFFCGRTVLGQNATGGFHVDDDLGTKNIEFNARAKDNGAGEGQMTFSGPVDLSEGEETEGDVKRVTSNLFMKVDFDCVVIDGNRAVMSGTVRDASLSSFLKRTVLLTVEDGGEGNKGEPDRFTWGVYDSQRIPWTPSDAELEFDDGWSMSWYETDAERQDDRGVLNRRPADVNCRSFDLATYDLIEVPQGGGNIQVRP